MVGKRKREHPAGVTDSPMESSPDSTEDLQEVFRRHFEAQFEPLPSLGVSALPEQVYESNSKDYSDESDWDGLSVGEESVTIEIVDHTTPARAARTEIPKVEAKEFMVGRVTRTPCLLNH